MARNHHYKGNRRKCVLLWVLSAVAIVVLGNAVIHSKIFSQASIETIDAPFVGLRNDHIAVAADNTPNGNTQPRRKWAYVYLMAGCDSTNPGNHLGMLYNVVVAARVLRNAGSKVDIVVMVEMFHSAPNDRLLPEEERMLRESGVKIKYMERSNEKMTFHEATLRKFEILKLTEYSRVLYMDADVIPFCSMDDLFDLSEPDPQALADQGLTQPVLRENMVLTWTSSPANGGFFMLRPAPGFYDEIQAIIERQEKEASLITKGPKFNQTRGWGHVFEGGDDVWTTFRHIEDRKKGLNKKWAWHCEHGDQGLLYYWVKYHRRDVSIIIGPTTEHWVDRDGSAVLDHRDSLVLDKYACVNDQAPLVKDRGFPSPALPYTSFRHFTGPNKPWLRAKITQIEKGEAAQAAGADIFWWQTLRDASLDLNFTIQFGTVAQTTAYGRSNSKEQLDAKIRKRVQQMEGNTTR